MKIRGWVGASLVVTATNIAALTPVYRDRAGDDVRTVEMAVCSAHLAGGYGETDRLRLVVRSETHVPVAGLDGSGMLALGFDESDVASLGDTAVGSRPLPAARPAWVRVQQPADSTLNWRAVAVGPTRQSVEGAGLIVRGRVGFGYESVAPPGMRLAAQLFATEPPTLYLGGEAGDRLRPLRQRGDRCVATRSVTLGNGASGAVWVSAIR